MNATYHVWGGISAKPKEHLEIKLSKKYWIHLISIWTKVHA